MNLARRLFLARSAALAATAYAAPRFKKNPFSLGVMSGDPSPDGFVLWIRLAPDPLEGGGMDSTAVDVDRIVAEDEGTTERREEGQSDRGAGIGTFRSRRGERAQTSSAVLVSFQGWIRG
jgi:phosphodiesterase/alkaline phosphatase D-like protein